MLVLNCPIVSRNLFMVSEIEDQPLPPVPGQIALEEMLPGGHVVPVPLDIPLVDGRPNMSVIRLAHDDPEDDFYSYEEASSIEIGFSPRLSKIIEVSEPSETSSVSMQRPSPPHSLAGRSVTSSSTDYGEIVRESTFLQIQH